MIDGRDALSWLARICPLVELARSVREATAASGSCVPGIGIAGGGGCGMLLLRRRACLLRVGLRTKAVVAADMGRDRPCQARSS